MVRVRTEQEVPRKWETDMWTEGTDFVPKEVKNRTKEKKRKVLELGESIYFS